MEIRCKNEIAPAPPEPPKASWWSALFLLGVSALVVFVRLRWLEVPLERDEGEYAYMGQLILEGVPPYQLAFNIKFPGIYATYAGIMALFGQTTAGIHLGFLCVNVVSILLVFLLGRRWLNSQGGMLAAGVYGLLSLSPGMMGQAAHVAHFVVLAALAGMLALSKAMDSRNPGWTFFSGFLFGIAYLMKQPGIFFGLFGLVLLLFNTGFVAERRKDLVRRAAIFCLGWSLPFGLTCLTMWWCGVFDAFWFWTVSYALIHGSAIPLKLGIREFGRFFVRIGPDVAFWVLAIGAFGALLASKFDRNKKFRLGALFVFSFLVVVPGLQFSPHYFVAMLPACALLIAWSILEAQSALRSRVGLRLIPAGTLVFLAAWFVSARSEPFFSLSPTQLCRRIYGDNPFPEAVQIADLIAHCTRPDAHIGVIGSEPEIFFYAHRRSATKYIYTYDVLASHEYAKGMQKHMARDIETIKPAFLVVVNISSSLSLWNLETPWFTEWLNRFVESYRLTGVVVYGKGEPKFYWDDEIAALNPEPEAYIAIYSLNQPASVPSGPPPEPVGTGAAQ